MRPGWWRGPRAPEPQQRAPRDHIYFQPGNLAALAHFQLMQLLQEGRLTDIEVNAEIARRASVRQSMKAHVTDYCHGRPVAAWGPLGKVPGDGNDE